MAIRYDREFNEYIQRVVSNFNRKVDRLEKQEKELLPDKVYVNDLKSQYDKRYELKRKLRELERFSNKGVEEVIKTEGGVKTTKYALENAKREKRRAGYVNTTKEIKRLQSKVTPTDITRRGALNLAEHRKDLFSQDLEKLTKREFDTVMVNVNRVLNYDKKNEQFQANLFQIIYNEAAYSGLSDENLDNITNTLSSLAPDDLLRLSKENPNIKAILDQAPTDGNYITQRRMREILEDLEEALPSIIKEYKS